MKEISDLSPDSVLAGMLDNRIIVTTSKSQNHSIRAYGDGEVPNDINSGEFISVNWNGGIQSVTFPTRMFKGNLLLSIYVKTKSDGRVKKNTISSIISQCVRVIDGKTKDGFCFTLNPSNVIAQTTVDLTTGYSTKMLNVDWHTTT